MWENLYRVDWNRLSHAYGRARNVPTTLRNMIAVDEKKRAAGWDGFWGALNHQGDFYDSTVAVVPFLIEAAANPATPWRESILAALRDRWLDSPQYSGDPLTPEPPGGIDLPTPMLADAEFAAPDLTVFDQAEEHQHDEDFDISAYRRMDLCAWQTGRAIHAGRATFERLLEDNDRKVVAAAASLLFLWRETRGIAKRALIRMIDKGGNAIEQAAGILEFGVYGDHDDVVNFAEWAAPQRPLEVRAAAALAWAWAIDPAPLPPPASAALADATVLDCRVLVDLPRTGIFRQGPWSLPANAANMILRLADNHDKELRWRAVQGFATEHATGKYLQPSQVVPVALGRLSDKYNRIRDAAAYALTQRGEMVLDIDPDAATTLIAALDPHPSADWGEHQSLDSDSSPCGHAARFLAMVSHRLTPAQRTQALAGIERAAHRYADRDDLYVFFRGMWACPTNLLNEQRDAILQPIESWGVPELLSEFGFPMREDKRLSIKDCDRLLADAYARSPQQTIAVAVNAVADVGKPDGRNPACGAADWLVTLGPAAQPALSALDAMTTADLPPCDQFRAKEAADCIRRSLLVTLDERATANSGEQSARKRIALLKCQATGDVAHGAELIAFLEHPDAYVRAGSAELVAQLASSTPALRDAIPFLQKLLTDDAAAEVGVAAPMECEGRLFHWRQERRSPRASAIRALFALGDVPKDDCMLKAILAESAHASVICGKSSMPCRFPMAQWRMAVSAAGGIAVADPLIRAVRQQCRNQSWAGNNAPYVCEAELAEVIRQFSGRLV